jgi:cell division protein FtsW
MFLYHRQILKHFNPHFGKLHYGIIMAVCALCLYGCLMVFSASLPISSLNHRVHFHPFHFIIRHLIALSIGVICAFFAYHTPLDFWAKKSRILLMSAAFLLMITLVVGREINGAKRWIPLGIINFQAAEYLKLVIIFYTADFCVRKLNDIKQLSVILLPIIVVVLSLCGLLLLQPDLGSLMVVAIEILGLVFLAGFPLRIFFSLLVLFGSGVYLVISLTPWRMKRILAFLDPWNAEFVQGTGYQLANSLIAFGRGQWLSLIHI